MQVKWLRRALRNHVIPYRVREQRVEILRVFHTARKWPPGFDAT